MMTTLTEQEAETLHQLYMKGCAVVVFVPDELEGVSQEAVMDRMTETGWEVIETLKQG